MCRGHKLPEGQDGEEGCTLGPQALTMAQGRGWGSVPDCLDRLEWGWGPREGEAAGGLGTGAGDTVHPDLTSLVWTLNGLGAGWWVRTSGPPSPPP